MGNVLTALDVRQTKLLFYLLSTLLVGLCVYVVTGSKFEEVVIGLLISIFALEYLKNIK